MLTAGVDQADNENVNCQKCLKPRPDNFPLNEEVAWVECEACQKWTHVLCTDYDPDVNLDEVHFICCAKPVPEHNAGGADAAEQGYHHAQSDDEMVDGQSD